MAEILSLWRSPLDKVAIFDAEGLRDRQPRCQIPYDEDFTQMTIYNYADYVKDNSSPDAALDKMFSDMQSNYWGNVGGAVFIPQQSYPVSAPDPSVRTHAVPDQCNIIGSGTGGLAGTSAAFFHFQITPSGSTTGSTFLTCTGAHSSGGKYFRGLSFEWLSTTIAADICISADGWNTIAVDCNFLNCPTAFLALGLSCGLQGCTIQYDSGPDSAVAVYLGGPQSFAIGPGEYQEPPAGTGVPTSCSAIAPGATGRGPTVHAKIRDLHLLNWAWGIDYFQNPDVTATDVTNVFAQCYTACVRMVPPSSGGFIYGEKYTSCTFQKTADSQDGAPIVTIDSNGQANTAVNDIEFLNCTVFAPTASPQPNQYCYQLWVCSNIRIIGGTVSNAGAPTTGSAGIAIGKPDSSLKPGRITILGVDLAPSYPQAQNVNSQQYAVLITGDLGDVVTIEDCYMLGYASAPVVVNSGVSVGSYLFVRNCAGYNDQNTPILSGTAHLPVGSPISAASAGSVTGGTSYYGPSLVVFTNTSSATTFTINGVSSGWNVPANAFVTYYIASPYDTIEFSQKPAAFSWLGK